MSKTMHVIDVNVHNEAQAIATKREDNVLVVCFVQISGKLCTCGLLGLCWNLMMSCMFYSVFTSCREPHYGNKK